MSTTFGSVINPIWFRATVPPTTRPRGPQRQIIKDATKVGIRVRVLIFVPNLTSAESNLPRNLNFLEKKSITL